MILDRTVDLVLDALQLGRYLLRTKNKHKSSVESLQNTPPPKDNSHVLLFLAVAKVKVKVVVRHPAPVHVLPEHAVLLVRVVRQVVPVPVRVVRVLVVRLVARERVLRLAVRVERVRVAERVPKAAVAAGQFGLLQDVVLQREQVLELFLRIFDLW